MSVSFGSRRGSRGNVFVGALVGLLMFVAAFPVLYFNEATENLAKVAATAIEYVEGSSVEEGTLIYSEGTITSATHVGDTFLTEEYVFLIRVVEFYGYEESYDSDDERYSYDKRWLTQPELVSQMSGNLIPSDLPVSYDNWINNQPNQRLEVGENLEFDGQPITGAISLTGDTPVLLSNSTVTPSVFTDGYDIQDNHLFYSNQGTGTISSPVLGDIRVSFSVIEIDNSGILVGRYTDEGFEAFITEGANSFLRFFNGETEISSVISILEGEYQTLIWVIRLLGFVLLFVGLLLLMNPVMTLFNFLPIVGGIGNFLIFIGAFVISVVLWGVTILVAIIAHNFLFTIIAGLVVAAIILLVIRKKLAVNPTNE